MDTIDSLYVHAPFCSRRCYYCDFAVKVGRSSESSLWVRAIAGELRAIHNEQIFKMSSSLETLYVGGGTPSLLSTNSMAKLREIVGVERLESDDLEWTCEANPESFNLEKASAWIRAGVNRVSLGVQTFQESALTWMGRLHSTSESLGAVQIAEEAGFLNISVDIIFGLPPSLKRDLREDLQKLLLLNVDHVSLYGLTVENGTPLARAVSEGKQDLISDSQYREEYLFAVEWLESHGYEGYEVSNFARSGKRSKHNANYWSGKPYLGLGNGAHSYLHPVRRWNVRDWNSYFTKAVQGCLPVENQENLNDEEHRLENLWLGLRTKEGLRIVGFTGKIQEKFVEWIKKGLAVEKGGYMSLTPEGWLIMDHLTLELEKEFSDKDLRNPKI